MSTTTGRFQVGATGLWTGFLKREDDSQLLVSALTRATCWLRDPATGIDIRGTKATPQVIFATGVGTNGFTFVEGVDDEGNAVTRISWNVTVADVALKNPALSREEHVADILVGYTVAGVAKVLRHTVRLRCVDTPGFCTYDDVAEVIEGLDETKARNVVEDAIEACGLIAEYRTKRFFRIAENVATVKSIRVGQRVVQLDRYPIISVASVIEDLDGKFDNSSLIVPAVDYWLPEDGAKGQIEHKWRDFLNGSGCWKSVHTGGLFSDTSMVPLDLRYATRDQIVSWWKRRDQAGLQSLSVPGSSISIFTQAPTLKLFDSIVNQYKKPRHW